jgi:regulator-associated protein of mTOR
MVALMLASNVNVSLYPPHPLEFCLDILASCTHAVQNPELPADVFTSCLTTPIKVSLRWFASRSLLRHDGITKELIDRIPGKQVNVRLS